MRLVYGVYAVCNVYMAMPTQDRIVRVARQMLERDGEGPALFGTTGLAICQDVDFPALGRESAGLETALLLVPAWDFDVDGWLHSRMAVLRGIEGGFAVARSGRMTLSDARGRVLAEGTSGATRVASVVATIAPAHRVTPYARFGDWLPMGCALLLGALLLPKKRVRFAPVDAQTNV